MRAPHVEQGDHVLVLGLVHIVGWADHRSWDSVCARIVDDYQPDYYQQLFTFDIPVDDSLDLVCPTALQLQMASDDALITCIVCLCAQWYPPDQRDAFSDVDE